MIKCIMYIRDIRIRYEDLVLYFLVGFNDDQVCIYVELNKDFQILEEVVLYVKYYNEVVDYRVNFVRNDGYIIN